MNKNLMLQTTKRLTPYGIWSVTEQSLKDKLCCISFKNHQNSLYFAYEHKDEEGYHFNLTNMLLSIKHINHWLGNYVEINTVPFILAYLTKQGISYTLDSNPVEITLSIDTIVGMVSAIPVLSLQRWFDEKIGEGRVVVRRGTETKAPTARLQRMLEHAIYESDSKFK